MRQGNALVHRYATHRNKGKHVGSSDARMLARMLTKINQFGGQRDRSHCGVYNVIRGRGESDHGTIVILVHVTAKHEGGIHRFDRLNKTFNNRGPATFTEIRHTLDKLIHSISSMNRTSTTHSRLSLQTGSIQIWEALRRQRIS